MEPPYASEEFDVLTVVILTRSANPPEASEDELSDLLRAHVAYEASLAERGLTVAHGPLLDQSDPLLQAISVFTVGTDAALAYAREDPMVRAGWFEPHAARWWTGVGKIAFPEFGRPVADRLPLHAMQMK
jgi:hypothetical protein